MTLEVLGVGRKTMAQVLDIVLNAKGGLMNINRARQEERKLKISQISATIKKSLSESKEISFSKLIMACSVNWGLSRRTSKEYIEDALFLLDMEPKDIGN